MDRSNADTLPHTAWKFLTTCQLRNMVIESRKRTKTLKFKACLHIFSWEFNAKLISQLLGCKRQISRLRRKLNDYQRVVMLLSQNKIAGVSRILAVSIHHGDSAQAMAGRLERAISGALKPHGKWTDKEYDTAFLVKAIGGPRLLYALQKAEAYPSLTSLRQQKLIPEITVSTGIPKNVDFSDNISAFLGEKGRHPQNTPKIGVNVIIDGAAIEQVIRFDFKRRCLIGICREHSEDIKKVIDDIEDIKNVADAIEKDKICHYGKDATLLGIAPVTGKENYHVTPLVLSASCKTEKGDQLAKWVDNFIQVYRDHPDGEM